MVAIADSVPKPTGRFRFILDRREVHGSFLVAPAILYVLFVVGVPFLMAVYYALSAYTIYDPSWRLVGLSNFVDVVENPVFRQNALQYLHLHFRIADSRAHSPASSAHWCCCVR